MNAGFSSLSALKAHLLHADLRAETAYDTPILQLGLGVAAAFEGILNRKLLRVVDDTYETRGGRAMILLPRYPLEEVATIEARSSNSDAWEVQTDCLESFSAASGLVNLTNVLGNSRWRVKTTYTGGYWWPTAEGDEEEVAIGVLTRAATVTLVSGAETAAITFATPLPFAPTSVSITLVVPSGQANVGVNVVGGSLATTGFTISLAAPLPASGYQLTYNATGDLYSPAGNPSSLPEGATELPAAIKTAWLLQVEALWNAHDKLGVSITKEPTSAGGTAALTSADLLPVVKEMLRDYVRYNMT